MINSSSTQLKKIVASPLFIRHQVSAKPRGHPWLDQLENLLQLQLSNSKLTMSKIAADLFLSERQLFRKVKKLTGKTPNLFLQELRLKKARQLLLSGNYETIKEVAHQVGYKRVDYFSNLFEKQYHQRPLDLLANRL